jgi:phosphatidylglycerophosphatase A
MKKAIEKQKPSGIVDYLALALTTFGVGYIPGAPGTYGSAVAVGIYLAANRFIFAFTDTPEAVPYVKAVLSVLLSGLCVVGLWAAGRSIPLLGNDDPSEAVVDEVIGQLITFAFVPFGAGWPIILAGFLLFRVFDIWKPFPINRLQDLPGGLGICADDILAGVYAGICLLVGHAIYMSL